MKKLSNKQASISLTFHYTHSVDVQHAYEMTTSSL